MEILKGVGALLVAGALIIGASVLSVFAIYGFFSVVTWGSTTVITP